MSDNTLHIQERAAALVNALRDNGFGDDEALLLQQVLCLSEEAGEAVGAFRRWSGRARRSGSVEDVQAELADVVITAYTVAHLMHFDLNHAMRKKLDVVFSRGWRTPSPEPQVETSPTADEHEHLVPVEGLPGHYIEEPTCRRCNGTNLSENVIDGVVYPWCNDCQDDAA